MSTSLHDLPLLVPFACTSRLVSLSTKFTYTLRTLLLIYILTTMVDDRVKDRLEDSAVNSFDMLQQIQVTSPF
jgi:hypothetical protein